VLEGVARVGGALAPDSPARAVVVCVLAGARAHSARDRAVQVHVPRIVDALTFLRPVVAVTVDVTAPWCAQTARGRTVLVHEVWSRLALAVFGPRGARLICVRADVLTHSARVRANGLHVVIIVPRALARTPPRGTRGVLIVTEADDSLREVWREHEHSNGKHD